MAKTNETTAAETVAPITPEPSLRCIVLTNGIVIRNAHHARGKVLNLTKPEADALLGLNPPAVRVEGIA